MTPELQKIEPIKVKITHLQFEAWPASGLLPSRLCFLHSYFTQRRHNAKKMADSFERLEKWMTRNH